ncbi:hypothetical protein SADUNF_Sadunf04G0017400 [Salix dunnii]|uniref:Uncharacterized protein n=1 Tax=Salix dunnii TaxID=1413687 RepID=A0A835K5H1_9ROSI|nr:hypothetical protein SADUNF_Sadunf04G0017400 [Salix dunnii]
MKIDQRSLVDIWSCRDEGGSIHTDELQHASMEWGYVKFKEMTDNLKCSWNDPRKVTKWDIMSDNVSGMIQDVFETMGQFVDGMKLSGRWFSLFDAKVFYYRSLTVDWNQIIDSDEILQSVNAPSLIYRKLQLCTCTCLHVLQLHTIDGFDINFSFINWFHADLKKYETLSATVAMVAEIAKKSSSNFLASNVKQDWLEDHLNDTGFHREILCES